MFKKWWFWVIVILILSSIGSAMKKNDNKETNIETILAESENTESENTESENTESKNTESENTESENTENENTESENTESENTESENTNLIDGKFELINCELDTSNYRIVGSLKNTTSKTYSYAQITFSLYDADGAQIGTTLDNINNWEPDGLWKFKALFLDNDVASYKLVNVQAF